MIFTIGAAESAFLKLDLKVFHSVVFFIGETLLKNRSAKRSGLQYELPGRDRPFSGKPFGALLIEGSGFRQILVARTILPFDHVRETGYFCKPIH